MKGPEGAPFQGAFVEAQNTKTRVTVIVLSGSHGQYRIEDLPAGDYRLQIRAVGFRADSRTSVHLAADQQASYDFALQKGMVRWNDISFYQARQLWPEAKGKDLIVAELFQLPFVSNSNGICDAGRRGLERPRGVHANGYAFFSLAKVTDQDADDIASYLTKLFGPDSVLPKSPADHAGI